jgi:hypothetical protein
MAAQLDTDNTDLHGFMVMKQDSVPLHGSRDGAVGHVRDNDGTGQRCAVGYGRLRVPQSRHPQHPHPVHHHPHSRSWAVEQLASEADELVKRKTQVEGLVFA